MGGLYGWKGGWLNGWMAKWLMGVGINFLNPLILNETQTILMGMNDRMKNFQAVLKALSECEVDYILIGGLAVAYHGVPRFTEDIDIFVKRNPDNISRLKNALRTVFDDESIDEITHDDLVEYAVVRYGTPDNFYIDVMDRIGEAFSYEDLDYEAIEAEGVQVRVATIETLIKLKKGTFREIDKFDVAMLKAKLRERK